MRKKSHDLHAWIHLKVTYEMTCYKLYSILWETLNVKITTTKSMK